MTWEPPVIDGHPVVELDTGAEQPTLLTVCAECGKVKTILFLTGDRWYCAHCRTHGAAPPKLYPIK